MNKINDFKKEMTIFQFLENICNYQLFLCILHIF
jgi:hypothetical protein